MDTREKTDVVEIVDLSTYVANNQELTDNDDILCNSDEENEILQDIFHPIIKFGKLDLYLANAFLSPIINVEEKLGQLAKLCINIRKVAKAKRAQIWTHLLQIIRSNLTLTKHHRMIKHNATTYEYLMQILSEYINYKAALVKSQVKVVYQETVDACCEEVILQINSILIDLSLIPHVLLRVNTFKGYAYLTYPLIHRCLTNYYIKQLNDIPTYTAKILCWRKLEDLCTTKTDSINCWKLANDNMPKITPAITASVQVYASSVDPFINRAFLKRDTKIAFQNKSNLNVAIQNYIKIYITQLQSRELTGSIKICKTTLTISRLVTLYSNK